MTRFFYRAMLLTFAAAASGCAMCANPDDEAYTSYGGMVERADPYHGRVGSAFAPPGGEIGTVSAEGPLDEWIESEESEPIPAEELPPPAAMPEATPEESNAEPMNEPMNGPTTSLGAPEVFFE